MVKLVANNRRILAGSRLSPAGGKTGHENVNVDLNGICVLDVFLDHFDHFVVHYEKDLEFLTVVIQQSSEGGNTFVLALVALLTVLAPETVGCLPRLASLWRSGHVCRRRHPPTRAICWLLVLF